MSLNSYWQLMFYNNLFKCEYVHSVLISIHDCHRSDFFIIDQ